MKKFYILLILIFLTGCQPQMGGDVLPLITSSLISDKYDASVEIKEDYILDGVQLKNKKIINTELDKYKNEPKDEIEVRIGDKSELLGGEEEFNPSIEIKRWNEVSFKITPDLSNALSKELRFEGEKIIYETDKMDFEMYEYEDGYKYIWYLNEKPVSNIIEFQIESEGLDFFYQPELTQEEIDAGAFRPENVIGSYAVYHKTKGVMVDAWGKDYKTGKAFHIYRPHLYDANGLEAWGNLHIENGIYSVEIPQDFLDNAVYPIKSNDTFGYTNTGGTEYKSTKMLYAAIYALGEAGTASNVSVYLNPSVAGNARGGIYNTSDTLLATSDNVALPVSEAWQDFTFTSPVALSAADYWLAFGEMGATASAFIHYDAGSSIYEQKYAEISSLPTHRPEPSNTFANKNIFIYATYTPAGGAEDTCTYGGTGDWNVLYSQNCYATTTTYVNGDFNLIYDGAGSFGLQALLMCDDMNVGSGATIEALNATAEIQIY